MRDTQRSPLPDDASARAACEAQNVFAVVNPEPWARAQMAFTLASHIILVPLGVSWAFMALVANYRGIKHDDTDAKLHLSFVHRTSS